MTVVIDLHSPVHLRPPCQASLVSLGTLMAFTVVCAAVLWRRGSSSTTSVAPTASTAGARGEAPAAAAAVAAAGDVRHGEGETFPGTAGVGEGTGGSGTGALQLCWTAGNGVSRGTRPREGGTAAVTKEAADSGAGRLAATGRGVERTGQGADEEQGSLGRGLAGCTADGDLAPYGPLHSASVAAGGACCGQHGGAEGSHASSAHGVEGGSDRVSSGRTTATATTVSKPAGALSHTAVPIGEDRTHIDTPASAAVGGTGGGCDAGQAPLRRRLGLLLLLLALCGGVSGTYQAGCPLPAPLALLGAWALSTFAHWLWVPRVWAPPRFRTPLHPWLPSFGLLMTVVLMGSLERLAWAVWGGVMGAAVLWWLVGKVVGRIKRRTALRRRAQP